MCAGMMSMRVYALLGRPTLLRFPLLIFFVVVQGVGVSSNIVMMMTVFKHTSRTAISGLNICDVGSTPSISWVTPTTDTLWMAYEVVLCGAVIRHIFNDIPLAMWKSPVRSLGTLVSVVIRDNLIHFFIVTVSMLITTLKDTNVISDITVLINMSPFLLSFQVAMVGPWLIINLRKRYEQSIDADMSDIWEMTAIAFTHTSDQKSG